MRWVLAVGLACAVAACGDNLGPPEPDSLVADPGTITLEIGHTAELSAHYSGGAFAPTDVTWTSTNPAIATVAGQGEHATVTAVAAGSATIAAEGQGRVGQVHVTVNPAHLVGIAITPPQPTLAAGTTADVMVIGTLSDGTSMDVTSQVTWSADQPNIASVDAGVVTAHVVGETTITATLDGLFSTTRVIVSAAKLVSIDVTPDAPSIVLGLTVQFTATGHFSDQSTVDITSSVTWASSVTTVATIAGTGDATTVALGSTMVSATKGTVVGMTTLTVVSAVTTDPAFSPVATAGANTVYRGVALAPR